MNIKVAAIILPKSTKCTSFPNQYRVHKTLAAHMNTKPIIGFYLFIERHDILT